MSGSHTDPKRARWPLWLLLLCAFLAGQCSALIGVLLLT